MLRVIGRYDIQVEEAGSRRCGPAIWLYLALLALLGHPVAAEPPSAHTRQGLHFSLSASDIAAALPAESTAARGTTARQPDSQDPGTDDGCAGTTASWIAAPRHPRAGSGPPQRPTVALSAGPQPIWFDARAPPQH